MNAAAPRSAPSSVAGLAGVGTLIGLVLAAAAATTAGCGGKGGASTTTPVRPAVTPCPDGAALDAAAIAAWQHGDGEVNAACVTLAAGGRGLWLLDGFLVTTGADGDALGTWTALVVPGGEVVSLTGEADVPFGFLEHTTANDWQAADLDGDGDDELLHLIGYAHMGYENTTLRLTRVEGGVLVAIGEDIPLDSDNSGAVDPDDPEGPVAASCTATWKLVPAGREQHLDITYVDDGGCERTGHHVYRLAGDALVEVP